MVMVEPESSSRAAFPVLAASASRATSVFLLVPGLAIFITVLAFNFFGDGLRDAADPYH